METEQEIANRMRCENFEQFQTLVRMHLSFELDLNTDTVEYVLFVASQLLINSIPFNQMNFSHSHSSRSDVVHNVKLVKTKKLFAFPKKSKHLQSNSAKSSNPPFNVSHFLTSVSLAQIQQMISFLMFDQSNFFVVLYSLCLTLDMIEVTNSPNLFFILEFARAQTSYRKAYSVGPARWPDKMS